MNVILCSFTNGSNNGGDFDTYWICPNCKSYNNIDIGCRNDYVNCDDCSFSFNAHEIKGLDKNFDNYEILNIGINDYKNYDYFEYLVKNNIIYNITNELYDENKKYIDIIEKCCPFGIDVGICFYISNDYKKNY